MPIFEYACDACGHTFERLTLRPQSVGQQPCPQCGSVQTTKVFSTFSTQGSVGASASGTTGAPAFR
ncbi:MAG: zinc ribbon domain-containing protein [Candidatus Tectomicrobia bacterium]|uniref:Zinc ribbon domain-containing protein n=1 Tax=Tectimicrobiota bacterium TaxID=2528274 RepID=A0A937W1C9_UNCTE|nr:zinc ribbon domain-containing protein [Candidatus Tectomicrobia bacterium]